MTEPAASPSKPALIAVPFRATAGEKGLWTRAAQLEGLSREEWMREVLNAAANSVLPPTRRTFGDEVRDGRL